MAETETLEPITVEQDGRILTGVGVSQESLQGTVDARADRQGKPGSERAEAVRAPEAPRSVADSEAPTRLAADDDADASAADAVTHPERNADGTFKPQPKLSRGQKRFDQLTAEREAERRRADAAEARATALENAQRSTRSASGLPGSNVQPATGLSESVASRAKPVVDQVGTKYPTYEDFLEDLSDWKAEQRIQPLITNLDATIRQRIEADRASRTFLDTVTAIRERGQKAYVDFDAVLSAADVEFPTEVLQAIVARPDSEHLQYQLAKDRPLAERIASLARTDPVSVGFELAQLVRSPAVASPASTAPAVSTSAPAPYQPVGSGSKTTTPSLQDLASDDSEAGYQRYAAKRRAERQATSGGRR